MSIHKEIALEDGICAHLAAQGWLYEANGAARYDRASALFPEDLLAWVEATQPDAWAALQKAHGTAAGATLAQRLRAALDKQGTLDVLRHGLDVVGLKQRLSLCQFRPALAMNEALQARYAANRLRVVRQVRYSLHHENSLDLVLFLNGIPVATAELKSDYTQSVQDAVDQYRYDRLPRAPGKNLPEPLLAFPGGALVHFAASNSEVQMCTLLAGPESKFLPFNRGRDFGAGNPDNPNGAPTAYLWEDIWQRDSWLEILGRYLAPVRDDKKRLQGWIFPRYHQLDATRRLLAAVLAEGPGGKYLIEHSAGSGKTNSIAWAAHFLADLHNAAHQKLFDTVLVVSDRTVLDKQLREAIQGFERTQGVVEIITGDGAAKSAQLASALAGGKKIVVCTIQTFPFALNEVRKLVATKGKRFAVIADEAHSSQSGQAAAKLKMTLTAEEQQDLADGGEASIEDLLAAQMAGRAGQDGGGAMEEITMAAKRKTKHPAKPREDLSAPSKWRLQHGDVGAAIRAADPETGTPIMQRKVVDTLSQMLAHGSISREMHEAGCIFRTLFRSAALDSIATSQFVRVAASSGDWLSVSQLDARRRVLNALDVLGGIDSPSGSIAWHVVGLEVSLRTWSAQQGWNGRLVSAPIACGILVAALGTLANHFGLLPRSNAA